MLREFDETACAGCSARPLGLCASLGDADLQDMQALAHRCAFAAREPLFVQGQPAQQLFTIASGMARLYKLLADGRRQIVGFALPGDFLGLTLPETHGFSADAIGPVIACAVPRAAFIALVEAKPALLLRLHGRTGEELSLAQEQMLILGRLTAEERIVGFLLWMRERWARRGLASATLALPMTRQDIADFLGLTIETVSRTLGRLARERMILIVPDGVRILDRDGLESRAA
jgi:CRP/FNR family transcriptional regulator